MAWRNNCVLILIGPDHVAGRCRGGMGMAQLSFLPLHRVGYSTPSTSTLRVPKEGRVSWARTSALRRRRPAGALGVIWQTALSRAPYVPTCVSEIAGGRTFSPPASLP